MNYKKSFAHWISAFAVMAMGAGTSHAGTGSARIFVSATVIRSCSIAFDQKAVGVECGFKNFSAGAGSSNSFRAIDLSQVAHSIERFDQLDGVAQIMVTF